MTVRLWAPSERGDLSLTCSRRTANQRRPPSVTGPGDDPPWTRVMRARREGRGMNKGTVHRFMSRGSIIIIIFMFVHFNFTLTRLNVSQTIKYIYLFSKALDSHFSISQDDWVYFLEINEIIYLFMREWSCLFLWTLYHSCDLPWDHF